MIQAINDEKKYQSLFDAHNLSLNQSWLWGQTRKKSHEVLRLSINEMPLTIYIKSVPVAGFRYGYLPRCFEEVFFTKTSLNELKTVCSEYNLSHIIVEPNVESSDVVMATMADSDYKNTGKTIQPNYTQVVDLTRSKEELLSGMKSKTRQYVRKVARQGVIVEEDNSESGFESFYDVMDSIISRKDFVMYDKNYFRNIYDTFRDSGHLRILKAINESEVIGALFLVSIGDTTYELYGGVNEVGARLRANYLLKWESFLKAHANGDKKYDMWGVSPLLSSGEFDAKDSMYEISKFKIGFGGRTVKYMPQFTYADNQVGYATFKAGLAAHKLMIKVKK